ncbi:thermonuclease family protein [bacterium]|nr:thermonuclease family protein [bacterium]
MKRSTLALLLVLTLVAGADQLRGLVDDVHDGDTVRLRTDHGLVRVRLESIDAPELKQPGGVQSRDYLRQLAPLNHPILVEVTGQDKYHRTLGIVFRNGQNLNLAMVRSGHAWAYRKYCHTQAFYDAEHQAQVAHAGIWASSTTPQPPWEFRHMPKPPKTKRTEFSHATEGNSQYKYTSR